MKEIGFKAAIKLLWQISNKKDKALLIGLFLLSLLRVFVNLVAPLVTACIVAKLSGTDASILIIHFPKSFSNTWTIVLAFAIFYAVMLTSSSIRALIKLYSAHMMNRTNVEALKFVLEYRKNFDLKMTNGEASYIIKNASENVAAFFEQSFVSFLIPIIYSIVALIYIATLNIYAFLVILGSLLLITLSIFYRTYFNKKIFKKLENLSGKINNHNLNNIDALPFIGLMKTKLYEIKILTNLNKEYFKNYKKQVLIYITYWIFIYITELVCNVGAILLIVDSTPAASLVAVLIVIIPYISNVFSSTENLGYQIDSLQQYAIKISRINLLKAPKDELIPAILPLNTTIEKITMKDFEIKLGAFHKTYTDVNFYKGKVNCLAGRSGGGKSSLINCLLGLKEYKSGQILINDNIPIASLFYENDKISVAFQDDNFFDRSAIENVMYPLENLDEKTSELLKKFDLDDISSRSDLSINTSMSGGEKKRLNLIRCMAKDKEVYILDEPTNDLDETNSKKVLQELQTLAKNAIVILISHDKRVLDISENIINI